MKNNLVNIVLVDQQPNDWFEDQWANESIEVKINAVFIEQVEEALARINGSHSTIHAVLINPAVCYDVEQLELVIKTCNQYLNLSVFFILEADEIEQRHKEFLQNGVVDYFSKSHFSITQLLHRLQQENRLIRHRKRAVRLAQQHVIEEPFLYCTEKDDSFTIYFAYYLDSIVKNAQEHLHVWMEHLFTILDEDEGTIFRQIYLPSDNGLCNYFLFQVLANSKGKAEEEAKDLIFEFNFLQSFADEQFIQWEVVKKIEVLEELIHPPHPKKLYLSQHSQPVDHLPPVVGFSTDEEEQAKEEFLLPQFFPISYTDFDTFISLLNLSNYRVDHVLQQETLSYETIEKLEQIALQSPKNHSVHFLLKDQKSLFKAYTVVYTTGRISSKLMHEISRIFYRSQAKEYKELPNEYVSLLMPQLQLHQIFRFPISEHAETRFNQVLNLEQYVPTNAFQKGIRIGKKNDKSIHIEEEQYKKHTYIIGKTGTGKTSILFSMIMDRILAGEGVALIDPHGDIYERVRMSIPATRRKDLITFDPSNPDNEFGFNMLEFDPKFPEQKNYIIYELIDIFSEIYDLNVVGGPMFELYFTNFLSLVMETIPKPSLDHVAMIMSDSKKLDYALQLTKDDSIREFVKTARETTGDHSFANFIPYITSKLTRFTNNYYLKQVVCNPNRTFDFREMIDSQKIFLVNMNKGKLGDMSVNFLGRILFSRLIFAAYSRSDIPEHKRVDFSLFIDEFQNFTSDDIVSALSESRKYHLQLILANQTLAQLQEITAKSILANVGSLITAAISPHDAQMIQPFFEPYFQKHDLVQMNNFQFLINTMYGNERSKPFVFQSIP